MIAGVGGFFLVYISTPADVCGARDPKGEYARACGNADAFHWSVRSLRTPDDAEIVIDTTNATVEAATEMIVKRLTAEGHLPMLKRAMR